MTPQSYIFFTLQNSHQLLLQFLITARTTSRPATTARQTAMLRQDMIFQSLTSFSSDMDKHTFVVISAVCADVHNLITILVVRRDGASRTQVQHQLIRQTVDGFFFGVVFFARKEIFLQASVNLFRRNRFPVHIRKCLSEISSLIVSDFTL